MKSFFFSRIFWYYISIPSIWKKGGILNIAKQKKIWTQKEISRKEEGSLVNLKLNTGKTHSFTSFTSLWWFVGLLMTNQWWENRQKEGTRLFFNSSSLLVAAPLSSPTPIMLQLLLLLLLLPSVSSTTSPYPVFASPDVDPSYGDYSVAVVTAGGCWRRAGVRSEGERHLHVCSQRQHVVLPDREVRGRPAAGGDLQLHSGRSEATGDTALPAKCSSVELERAIYSCVTCNRGKQWWLIIKKELK